MSLAAHNWRRSLTGIGVRRAIAPLIDPILGGWRHLRAHGAAVRRARVLCFTADLLEQRRPTDWRARGDRLYRRAARDLTRVPAFAGSVVAAQPDSDVEIAPAARARALLRTAEAPYRRAGLAIVGLAASLAATLALLVALVCWISPSARNRLFPPDLAAGAPWTASSNVAGEPIRGVGPASAPDRGLFFHTQPSDHPWLELDLGRVRVIRSIRIENRLDCCQDRGVPLNFEILDPATRQWRVVVQRRAGFTVWTRSFPPVRARQVRLRIASASGLLHLHRVSVFEW